MRVWGVVNLRHNAHSGEELLMCLGTWMEVANDEGGFGKHVIANQIMVINISCSELLAFLSVT